MTESAFAVFRIFLRLGLTSFGGPIAHLGYFREAFVVRRKWLDDAAYADLVALCQMLPGPASSQAGFALGMMRRGWSGAFAAWLGFTLPSALLLFGFAALAVSLTGPVAAAALQGLKIVAVAVVGHAVWGMARSLTPDGARIAIAAAAALLVLLLANIFAPVIAILLGGLLGLMLCRAVPVALTGHLTAGISRPFALGCLAVFFAALLASPWLGLFGAFYASGALVFGGGHVVLPLLHDALVRPGWIAADLFLTGYGAAQAVPGPLFAVAAYLGAVVNGWSGALLALAGIFLPGLLVLAGTLPFWDALRARPRLQGAMRGVNAAVVGILAAALYSPLWTSAIIDGFDMALAAAGFLLLTFARAPALLVVAALTAASVMRAVI